jgi:carbon-monoxide dehydrogenase large subunit
LTTTVRSTLVGTSVLRTEDPALLSGRGGFVDDVNRPNQLWARVVRSTSAHARIRAIGTSAAARHPGVRAVITAADVSDVRIPIRLLPTPEAERVRQPPLAREVVRYVGEPLAVVVAENPYLAEDAAERVEVELDALPALLDPVAAAEASARPLHPVLTNVINRSRARHGGDVDRLFAEAAIVVSDSLRVQRNTGIPLETRGLVAEYDEAGFLTVWGPALVKHFNRIALAELLAMEVERIRFIEPDVGGGFGVRGEFYPEDYLIPWLAMKLGCAVKWIEDRHEHFVATNHARDQQCEIEMAAAADGRLLAFRANIWINQGAYARTHGGLLLPLLAVHHLPGPYRWGGFEIDARSILTNKTPSGTYRGPSQCEPTFFRERLVDRIAARLGIDPAELRELNLVPAEAMPYRVGLGDGAEMVYDSGDYPHTMRTLLEEIGYPELKRDVAARRAEGEQVSLGLAAYIEEGGIGPWESAHVVPQSDGRFTIHVGIAAVGQGVRTALAQIAGDALGVELERIEISHRDTDLVTQGFGAFASRTTALGGGAIVGAVRDLERRAREAAAALLEAEEDELEVDFEHGVRLPGQAWIPVSELGCEGQYRFDKARNSFSMGVSLVLAEVDRDTREVKLRRVVVCHDVGRVVNPMLVAGQIAGAAVQGAAGALLESLPYDENGQPLVTSFLDYAMPTAAEMPRIESIVLELSPHRGAADNPLGIKGAGESGIVGTGAAVANAVCEAIGRDLSVLPISPTSIVAAQAGDQG